MSNIARISRTLARRYVIALSLIGLLSTAAWFSLYSVIEEQAHTAAIVNYSGRQRMLSQRIAFFSSQLVLVGREQRPAVRARLREGLELMRREHAALVHGDAGMGLPSASSAAIRAMYFQAPMKLDEQVRQYLAEVQALMETPDEELRPDHPLLQGIVTRASSELLASLDRTVRQYQAEGEATVGRLSTLEAFIWAGTLLLLVVEGMFIFRPSIRLIRNFVLQIEAAEQAARRGREKQEALRELLEQTLSGAEMAATLTRCLERVLRVSWLGLLPGAEIYLAQGEGREMRLAARFDGGAGTAAADHAVALVADGGAIGSVVFHPREGDAPNPDRADFLVSAAGVLAAYIGRKRIEDELRAYRGNLEAMVERRTVELSARNQRIQAILRTMQGGLLQVDAAGAILNINASAQEMFGYREDELVGRNLLTLMPERLRSGYAQGFGDPGAGMLAKVAGRRIEVEGLRKDGSAFPLELAVTALPDEAGPTFIAGLRDMTPFRAALREREAAQAAAERLARIKSDFLSNMSHEIRTPLNAVLGVARIGYRESAGRAAVQGMFARILDAGRLLLGVVNDILDFSKLEAGKLAIDRQAMHLSSTLGATLGLVAERAAEKGLELKVDIAPEVPSWVVGDALRIRQILVNLLANAVKFTARGGVDLAVRRQGEELAFSVRDRGIGMTPEAVSRLFQPFEQADTSTTRRYGGTGLGLAISQTLAGLMGGRIEVASRPGEGSVFTLLLALPATQEPADAAGPDAGPAGAEGRLAGLRILAAEDNEMNRYVLEDLLGHEGARIDLVADGRQAVAAVARDGGAYDVVLMDVQMPEMDGLEATRRLRGLRPELPVIGLTAHALAEEHARCREAGMRDVVTKPIELDVLVASLLHFAAQAGPGRVARAAGGPTPAAVDERDPGVDWAQLQRRYADRPALLARTCARFLEAHADKPGRLLAAAAAQDWPRLGELARAVAGDAEFFAAAGLMAEARNAAALALAGSPEAGRHGERLARALDGLLEAIRQRPSAPPAADPEGFDLAAALARVNGNREMLMRFLNQFLERNAGTLAAIAAALEKGDIAEARRRVHGLKGAAGTIGAVALQGAAGRMEGALSGGDGAACHAQELAGLTRAWQAAQAGIAALRDGKTGGNIV